MNSLKFPYDDDPNINSEDIPTIVLLLESPHEKEYDPNFKKIAPAQDNPGTGENIERHIGNLLSQIIFDFQIKYNILPDGNYRLIIANPVPYQTSIAYIHGLPLKGFIKKLRDNIWWECMKIKDIENRFIDRIRSYNPFLILNACTQSKNDTIKKKDLITDILSQNIASNIFETYHPSIKWNAYSFFPKNLKITIHPLNSNLNIFKI